MKTLSDVRAFIEQEAKVLDPRSRYISDLLDMVEYAGTVEALENSLLLSSRGRFWAGTEAWEAMTLEEKLRSNLITNETSMMRFAQSEIDYLRMILIGLRNKGEVEILSLPCSHGEEAVSLAIECMERRLTRFKITGYDIQPSCIEVARSGRIPLSGLPGFVTGHVDAKIMDHLEFHVQDVLEMDVTEDSKKYDLVVCRNFLGYFKPSVARQILVKLFDLTKDPGYVMLDPFIIEKHPDIFQSMARLQARTQPFFKKDTKGVLEGV